MKINMKNNSEDKSSSGAPSIAHANGSAPNGNTKIRIAVFGQHEVGKSGKDLICYFQMSCLVLNINHQPLQLCRQFCIGKLVKYIRSFIFGLNDETLKRRQTY